MTFARSASPSPFARIPPALIRARPHRRTTAVLLAALALACGACRRGPGSPQPPDPTADHPGKHTPSLDALRMDRAEADALMASLARLPKFPLRLSELEAHVGHSLKRHFNPESFDPTFVHDRGGQGVNIGGTPIFHPGVDPQTPLLVELRSQYYPRYDDERKFDRRPPFAKDDPIIDHITISDAYVHGAPPPAPGTAVFEGEYAHVAERWSIAPLHDGFRSLLTHDRRVNPEAKRWVFEITTDRGRYFTPAEAQQVESTLIGFLDAVRDGKDLPTVISSFEREHPSDTGIPQVGVASYNVRFFDTLVAEGPHAGDFLRQEGLARALYLDVSLLGEAKVPLPRFFAALGFESVTLDPAQVREVPPGLVDGGLLYYDEVSVERDGWSVRAVGFYPVENGTAAQTLDLSRFRVTSLTIRHEVRS